MNQASRYLLTTLPSIIIATVICYLLIDRPLAMEMNTLPFIQQHNVGTRHLAVIVTQLAYLVILGLFILLFICRYRGMISRFVDCLTLLCLSVAISFFSKSVLQYIFGRVVPRYRGSHTLLFVRNPHLYGFHWFSPGSFPSGHMCVFSAALLAISLFYPRARWCCLLLGLALAALLMIMNYHFLSDEIAGTYLGITITLATFAIIQPSRRA